MQNSVQLLLTLKKRRGTHEKVIKVMYNARNTKLMYKDPSESIHECVEDEWRGPRTKRETQRSIYPTIYTRAMANRLGARDIGGKHALCRF